MEGYQPQLLAEREMQGCVVRLPHEDLLVRPEGVEVQVPEHTVAP
jgi:hypothetical protein